MLTLTAQLEEYKGQITALAEKAVLADALAEKLSAIETEKAEITSALEASKAIADSLAADNAAQKAVIADLEIKIASMDAEKKTADEKALELVASLGLNSIPVITITETDKPTAESIRAKYMAISDSQEKAKFYAENKNAILNGVVE